MEMESVHRFRRQKESVRLTSHGPTFCPGFWWLMQSFTEWPGEFKLRSWDKGRVLKFTSDYLSVFEHTCQGVLQLWGLAVSVSKSTLSPFCLTSSTVTHVHSRTVAVQHLWCVASTLTETCSSFEREAEAKLNSYSLPASFMLSSRRMYGGMI